MSRCTVRGDCGLTDDNVGGSVSRAQQQHIYLLNLTLLVDWLSIQGNIYERG